MYPDRHDVSFIIQKYLRLLGKPFILITIGLLTCLYWLVKPLDRLLLSFHQASFSPRHRPTLTLKPLLKTGIYTLWWLRRQIKFQWQTLPRPTGLLHPRPPLTFKPLQPLLKPSLLVFTAILLFGSVFLYVYVLKGLPHPKRLIEVKPAVSTKIYARDGRLLYKFYDQENRSIVSLSQIPQPVIQATLAIEDSQFYQHAGFSLKGITRAFKKNLGSDTIQGGSTITQQLIKSTLLSSEKTLQRKLKELVLAIAVESYFTKDEILTMYFNQIPYGGLNYGIEEAAQYYFAKSIKDVNLAESALLAGLPAAPTNFSPFGADPQRAIARQHLVLQRMVQEGYLSQAQADTAKTTPLQFASPKNNILAPHFVMYVKDKLVEEYGETALTHGGLEVMTSLDLDIQELAQYAIDQELAQLKSVNVSNAAVLVTNPKTGEVLAMVGSRDYFDVQHDGQVNVTLRPRQPGSSIKVVTYALALEKGYTPATIIDDSPITYHLPGSEPYTPKNYDGRYHGRVTLRQALANSYNIPAVKTLASLGVSQMLNQGRAMGITTWEDDARFGLALTLGGGEVTMVDMAVVFGSLANTGKRLDLHPIVSVTDFTQSLPDAFACSPKPGSNPLIARAAATACPETQVVKPEVAALMSNILADNQARSPAFGSHSLLEIPGHQVAVKTGTTNSLRDNWTIGYTDAYLVAVWVGNNDNTPMSRVASGITGATPIWHTIMSALLKDTPSALPQSADLVSATICPLTNTLTCPACPNPKTELFTKDTVPQTACNDAMLLPYLTPNPTPPAYSTTYVEPTQPLPSPARSAPDFTPPFSGRSRNPKVPRPLR